MNPTIALLTAHRSIRKFTDQPIDPDLFEQLVLAGQAAASSSFMQAATIVRVTDPVKRAELAHLANDQPYVAAAAEFLVICADLHRAVQCCEQQGETARPDYTEQMIIATVDAALMAQNIVVAAESAGLGICYIGALRNKPDAVAALLDLPDHAYAVFGLCLGWPDQDPEVKPRLPVDLVLHENSYRPDLDSDVLAAYDAQIKDYYATRTDNQKSQTWSAQMAGLLSREARPHMLGFLRGRGLIKK
jgi:nitroreductase